MTVTTTLDAVIDQACAAIAPTWPLDRFIAVNPFWELVDQPLPAVSARLAALSGARLLMPRAWFREEWRQGRLRDEDLEEAIAEAGAAVTVADLHARMDRDEPSLARRARVMDVADAMRDLAHEVSWRDFITHSSSQFCAAYFDDGQARLGPDREGGLYASWHRQVHRDHTPVLLLGFRAHLEMARELAPTARDMIGLALQALDVPTDERQAYLTGLLLDLNGWAAWCAYLRWTARLAGGVEDHLVDLLAIRIAWEWLLLRSDGGLVPAWRRAMAAWPGIDAAASHAQADDWLLQRAIEIAWQRAVCRQLPAGLHATAAPEVSVQAAFCIDVRSEVFRRALEAQPGVQTIGFAGFFGMPIEYAPTGSASARPQLPGLLAPRLRVTDAGVPADLAPRRTARLALDAAWKSLKTSALSSFAFVESLGLVFGGKLIADAFGRSGPALPERAGLSPAEHARRKPRLTDVAGGGVLGLEVWCFLVVVDDDV
ncbi:MAG: Na-translocating system protein MpsB [Proteobacteria bacterium]|nr:Na-translocating system protein MpsB [Pseudomonadota bacterium]